MVSLLWSADFRFTSPLGPFTASETWHPTWPPIWGIMYIPEFSTVTWFGYPHLQQYRRFVANIFAYSRQPLCKVRRPIFFLFRKRVKSNYVKHFHRIIVHRFFSPQFLTVWKSLWIAQEDISECREKIQLYFFVFFSQIRVILKGKTLV